jgi:endoglucanase
MRRTALIISVLSLLIISTDAFASKLVWLKVVDNNFIMAQFKDGDVCFMDNGQGDNAYTGNHYYGWDWVVSYSSALSTTNAVNTANWTIKSSSDANYGTTGLHPTNCYRKSKLNGMSEGEWVGSDYVYSYTMEHNIYMKLPVALTQGKTYTIEINPNTNSDTTSKTLNFDIFNSPSEAIHVNLVGYLADASIKAVDLYIWMGNGGARDYSSFVGKKVYIYNVNTSASQQVGTVAFWKTSDVNTGSDVHWFNLTMSTVWTADFTGFNTPGTYRIAIEGVGCSENFEIKKYAYFEPFRVSTIGYFYMRIGEDSNYPGMPVPRRPLYIPGVSPSDTKVYITTLSPIHPDWASFSSSDPWDKKDEWAAYKKTGSPQNNNAYGGHSDAADWDRHLGHVINIYDMLLPYILTDGRLNDDNLQIVESGNGIPDILDEARNEVDFWLNLRDGAGYGHGLNNPGGSIPNNLYQAGATPMAAWANAANASMLAYCFMLAGINDLRDTYTTAAITAYNYANGLADPMLSATQGIGDVIVRGKDLKMTAAAFLYNLTGNTVYENDVNSLSEATSNTSTIMDTVNNPKRWDQIWGTAAYLKTKRTVHYPTLFSRMKASIINEAKNMEANLTSSRPSRRATDDNLGWWKTAHNVQRCIVAHAVADSPSDKSLFENAMVLEADWGLGRNNLNMIYMTTAATNLASKRSVENCYTTGRNDGTPGVHPGHTPYLNIQDWWDGMVMFKSSWLTEKCYPVFGSDSNGWPKAEAYFNTRYVFSHSEFTPQQTMNGKAALYGYLYGLYKIAADFDGDSNVDMLDLADFADSWLKVPGNAGYDSRANLYADPSGIVDFYDFAVFANQWQPAP